MAQQTSTHYQRRTKDGITRRDFLKYCGVSAAALGLSKPDLIRLEEALANPGGPKVIWLQGSSCTGCSMSFLNFINPATGADPTDAGDILLNHIDLLYHPNLMAMSGQSAAAVAEQAYSAGGYILAVEGGCQPPLAGALVGPGNYNGQDITFLQVVQDSRPGRQDSQHRHLRLLRRHPRGRSNPTQIKSVSAATGKSTINIAAVPLTLTGSSIPSFSYC